MIKGHKWIQHQYIMIKGQKCEYNINNNNNNNSIFYCKRGNCNGNERKKQERERERGSYRVGGRGVSQHRFPMKTLTHTWSHTVTVSVKQVVWVKSDYLIQLNLVAIGCEQQNPVHGFVKGHRHAHGRCLLITAVSTDCVWNSRYVQWDAPFLERTHKPNADCQVTQKPSLHSMYSAHNQL